MVPAVGLEPSAGMVGSRGFEPRSARSERAASADCATSRDDLVPLGGLEPPPRGLRARYAPLTLQRGVELIPGIEFGRRPYQGRRLPLHQISSGANDGIRTRTSRLGRPVGDRYPTFALVRPTGIEPVPPRWQRGMLPPHPGRTWTGAAHRPIDIVSVFKDPTLDELVGSKGFEPKRSPRGERGYGPPADHPVVPPIGDSARIRTRTHELWRLGCFCTATLPMSPHVSPDSKTQPPSGLAHTSSGLEAKTKKAF